MKTRQTTPQELVEKLLEHPQFQTVADIARASEWNYQRLQRWKNWDVGGISQDDMADLLNAMKFKPSDYGVQPSIAWERRNLGTLNEPPEWFKQYAEQQAAFQADVISRLDLLLLEQTDQ